MPYIRTEDGHFLEIPYQPNTCGTHNIVVEASAEPGITAMSSVAVDVGIDHEAAIGLLIDEVRDLRLAKRNISDRREKFELLRKLRWANRTLNVGWIEIGVDLLDSFNDDVEVLEGRGKIMPEKAGMLIAQSNQIISCVQ